MFPGTFRETQILVKRRARFAGQMRVAGDAFRPFRERFLHDLGGRGNTWICHNQTRGATTTLKWRGECANGMDERCEANLLIASVRPAVGRAVFIIREHAIFFGRRLFHSHHTRFPRRRGRFPSAPAATPHGGGVDCLSPSSIPMAFLSSLLTR